MDKYKQSKDIFSDVNNREPVVRKLMEMMKDLPSVRRYRDSLRAESWQKKIDRLNKDPINQRCLELLKQAEQWDSKTKDYGSVEVLYSLSLMHWSLETRKIQVGTVQVSEDLEDKVLEYMSVDPKETMEMLVINKDFGEQQITLQDLTDSEQAAYNLLEMFWYNLRLEDRL